jgi:uncharacterized repeat protein (TIGR03803 family)
LATRNGAIFGTSFNGGTHNEGVLYKYDIALNVFNKTYDFEFATKGAYPNGELIELPANAPNGISDITNATDDLFVYPNPANNYLTIKQFRSIGTSLGSELIKEVKIYNVLGKEVLGSKLVSSQVLSVDVSALQSGVYFVEASTEIGGVRKKFVKQ